MIKENFFKLFSNIADDEDIDGHLEATDIVKGLVNKKLTIEAFKEKMKDKDFKAFMDSERDKYFQKALETWKTNNLEKELEPFIQEKYPDLVTDPTQKELAKLRKELEDEKAANTRKDLLNQAIQYATEKKIPTSLVEKFLAEDIEKTKENLNGFVDAINPWVDSKVDERLGASSWIPGGSKGNSSTKSLGEQLAEEANNTNKVEGPNPWA